MREATTGFPISRPWGELNFDEYTTVINARQAAARKRSVGRPRDALRRSTYASAVLRLLVRHFYVDILRNQEKWDTLAQNKMEMKKAADELYQLPETDTESSAPSEENDE
ncbi:hypothetical protein EVAR_42987_1 [Eumeta japonica]|uniref:Uncharacterized protein n=1 Tax=Eumeta variegata TaxID=151549 RepID=A0A4C1WDP5_EUMVA|nr:hypothetical protein EVAR_42987_1 [Eumeta japonica]